MKTASRVQLNLELKEECKKMSEYYIRIAMFSIFSIVIFSFFFLHISFSAFIVRLENIEIKKIVYIY